MWEWGGACAVGERGRRGGGRPRVDGAGTCCVSMHELSRTQHTACPLSPSPRPSARAHAHPLPSLTLPPPALAQPTPPRTPSTATCDAVPTQDFTGKLVDDEAVRPSGRFSAAGRRRADSDRPDGVMWGAPLHQELGEPPALDGGGVGADAPGHDDVPEGLQERGQGPPAPFLEGRVHKLSEEGVVEGVVAARGARVSLAYSRNRFLQ